MADGRHCLECGFTWKEHTIVAVKMFALKGLPPKKRKEREAVMQKKFPGICSEFVSGKPKPKRR